VRGQQLVFVKLLVIICVPLLVIQTNWCQEVLIKIASIGTPPQDASMRVNGRHCQRGIVRPDTCTTEDLSVQSNAWQRVKDSVITFGLGENFQYANMVHLHEHYG
jgi:hypothetical protein